MWPRAPPLSALFPYTTLFRSSLGGLPDPAARHVEKDLFQGLPPVAGQQRGRRAVVLDPAFLHDDDALAQPLDRSEEHTSELQSLRHLVCRLLLEKEKRDNTKR